MIIKTITPRNKANVDPFRFDVPFDGDISKTYSCEVDSSNLPCPKVIGFTTKMINGIAQNYIVLEFEKRCHATQIRLIFRTEIEVIEEKKVKFITWLSGYFTWLNFIFRIFSLKTLKIITKTIAVCIAIPIMFGAVYAVTEWSYESITDDNFEDSSFIVFWSNFTIPRIGKYFREHASDDASEFGEFVKEKTVDAFETTKEVAGEAKEAVTDKIEDITD